MTKRETLGDWFEKHMPASRPQFTEDHFKPYVEAIGQLLLAWNDLHERLGALFTASIGYPKEEVGLAIWHKTRMDFAKRELLKTTIEYIPEYGKRGRPKLVKEIQWILSAAKELEGFRDDSAHGPLQALSFFSFPGNVDFSALEETLREDVSRVLEPQIVPNTFFGNPRAIRLAKEASNLLADFSYAKERTLILRDYAIAIEFAWMNAHVPWPDRPVLPNRGNKKSRHDD